MEHTEHCSKERHNSVAIEFCGLEKLHEIVQQFAKVLHLHTMPPFSFLVILRYSATALRETGVLAILSPFQAMMSMLHDKFMSSA
jgi:hypothetical protein